MHSLDSMIERGLLLLCDLSQDGSVLHASDALLALLGREQYEFEESRADLMFSRDSCELLNRLIDAPPADEKLHGLELTLTRRSGDQQPVLAIGLLQWRDGEPARIRLAMIPLGSIGQRLGELRSANEVMRQMLHSAKVAYWCIEFSEAVDMSASTGEVIRQVFENRSYWRMCNRAMADVYEMPADVDFSQQPVRLYWPRSPANEEFVRRLVENNFCVDGALSVDRRHDGSPAYVENDVRACVEDGKLLRMWGSIRDVGQTLRVQHDADDRVSALRRVFDAVPDAVVVVDESLQPQWRNAAFEQAFGITRATQVVNAIMDRPLPDRTWHRLMLTVVDGQKLPFDVHCSAVLVREGVAWRVAVLRAALGLAEPMSELHP